MTISKRKILICEEHGEFINKMIEQVKCPEEPVQGWQPSHCGLRWLF